MFSRAPIWSAEQNPLRRYVQRIGWSEEKAMNVLQDHGIISDNCVAIDDVGNYAKAMMWLHSHMEGRA